MDQLFDINQLKPFIFYNQDENNGNNMDIPREQYEDAENN